MTNESTRKNNAVGVDVQQTVRREEKDDLRLRKVYHDRVIFKGLEFRAKELAELHGEKVLVDDDTIRAAVIIFDLSRHYICTAYNEKLFKEMVR